jgi:hypothetical protein
MRVLLMPLLLALLVSCSSGEDPPPTPTPRTASEVTTLSSVTPQPVQATATVVPPQEPTAALAVATQAPPPAPQASPTPSCAQASPQDVSETMQTLNTRIATASPIEQVALRASLSSLDRNSDNEPDAGVCQSTLQAARLVASQPSPSRP